MGKNPHRLMNSAQRYLPASYSVSTTCYHPHSAIQWGIDLDMARNLDQMASMLTGLPIRSQENHYNNHRDEYDAVVAVRKQFAFGVGCARYRLRSLNRLRRFRNLFVT